MCEWTWRYSTPDTLQNAIKEVTWKQVVLSGVLVHLLCFIPSILQTQHQIFHFFPVLLLCHISRAWGTGWSHQHVQCQTKVSISKPDGHSVQALVSERPRWLASWYKMFYTLSLSIQTPESAQCWESDSLLLIWEKGTMTTWWEDFGFLSSVYVLSRKGWALHSQAVQG